MRSCAGCAARSRALEIEIEAGELGGPLNRPDHVGCALGYLDFRYAARMAHHHRRLAAWFDEFSKRKAMSSPSRKIRRGPGRGRGDIRARPDPHPEGGHFRETFRDPAPAGGRSASTAIYYCWERRGSRWHRVDAWRSGTGMRRPAELSLCDDGRALRRLRLGNDLAAGERPQAAVARAPGRRRGASAPGHWSAAPWRRASISRASSCAGRPGALGKLPQGVCLGRKTIAHAPTTSSIHAMRSRVTSSRFTSLKSSWRASG